MCFVGGGWIQGFWGLKFRLLRVSIWLYQCNSSRNFPDLLQLSLALETFTEFSCLLCFPLLGSYPQIWLTKKEPQWEMLGVTAQGTTRIEAEPSISESFRLLASKGFRRPKEPAEYIIVYYMEVHYIILFYSFIHFNTRVPFLGIRV